MRQKIGARNEPKSQEMNPKLPQKISPGNGENSDFLGFFPPKNFFFHPPKIPNSAQTPQKSQISPPSAPSPKLGRNWNREGARKFYWGRGKKIKKWEKNPKMGKKNKNGEKTKKNNWDLTQSSVRDPKKGEKNPRKGRKSQIKGKKKSQIKGRKISQKIPKKGKKSQKNPK